MDLHIFADLDLGNENLADPTNPDPKHWFGGNELEVFISLTDIMNYDIFVRKYDTDFTQTRFSLSSLKKYI